jgi:hypothetical protein
VDGNDLDTGPLAGWVIIIAQGKTLLGRLSTTDATMTPVYELITMMQMVQQDPRQPPQLMTMRQVQPLLTFPGLKSIPSPASGILIPIASLSSKERRELAKSVEACEQLMGAMRAQESGLVLPPPGSRVNQP